MKVDNSRYQCIGIIGQGSYGKVYLAQDLQAQKLVAIKQFKFRDSQTISSSTLREFAILKGLQSHSNIVQFIDAFFGKKQIYLVMEYVELDLLEYWKMLAQTNQPKPIKSVMLQILKGVNHIHMNRVVHRDLKTNNILINPTTGEVKITDFGFSKKYLCPDDLPMTANVIVKYYRAPELF